MKRLLTACVGVALLVGSMGVWAGGKETVSQEETADMPSYIVFLASCSTALSENASSVTGLTDDERMRLSTMVCHCSYEELGPTGTFSATQFEESLHICGAKVKKDPEGFVTEYGRKVRAALQRYQDDDEDF